MSDALAFDKVASARHYDENGFLHVSGTNISKACVNPYMGAEIPAWEQLNLDPKRIYYILRPAEELAKAALTCNMIPLMDAHIEVSAMDLENPDIAKHQVGNTGQAGEFKAPYLINDLVIQKAGAIEGVNSKEVCELSCAYRHDVVMTPGVYEGQQYDGCMMNIRFNHVALVEEGRAGPDVMVRDAALKRPSFADALRRALQPDPIRVALGLDGDLPGHDFHGNQWSTVGASSKETGKGKDRVVTRIDAKGKPLSAKETERMNKLGVPPAWKDVHIARDPKADVQATGIDKSGKKQSIYSKEHDQRSAAEKFARLKDFDKARPALVKQATADMKNGDNTAAAICLINATGFRVGNEKSARGELGKVATFGATTILGKNVIIKGNDIKFKFVGKHGVDIEHRISDPALAKFLTDRKSEVGARGKMFETTPAKTAAYIKRTTGDKEMTTKDFRTWHGTMTARAVIGNHAQIKGEAEFKKYQKEVATKVSEHLHNSPDMALKAYIDPAVWGKVRRIA
jgi:DNA topoisomerase IB